MIETKIYLVSGLGYIVGEQLHDWKNKIIVKNAGVLYGDSKHIAIKPPIIHWFKNQLEKIQRFEIPKHLIIDEDDPMLDVLRVYDIYVKKINEQVGGIKIANEQDMKKVVDIIQKFKEN